MTTYRATTYSGKRITLASDNSLTLGLLTPQGIEELTADWLSYTISPRSLRRLLKLAPPHSSEQTKLERALGIA